MYSWIEHNIQSYAQFVRVMKKKEDSEILLYRHKQSEKYLVVRKFAGSYPVYERLVQFQHENLCNCYEVACKEEKTIVVEEYIEGITIAELIQDRPLSVGEVKRLALQICEGVIALHRMKIIHRDIKPENIVVQTNGNVKLIDFDASRIYRLYETKDTRIIGTVGYAAPEQYGEAQSDERTDIYALGILFNVMLTGKHPVNQQAVGKFGRIIGKCIQVNPNKRYKSVEELKEDINKVKY